MFGEYCVSKILFLDDQTGTDCDSRLIATCYTEPMASRSEHCADCRRELGEPFDHVHEWLDALFKVLHQKHPSPPCGTTPWQASARHHAGGVEKVRKMWGARAARAAEIHIMRDCSGVVPSERDARKSEKRPQTRDSRLQTTGKEKPECET